MDPSLAPGTGAPVSGGFTYYQVSDLLDAIAAKGHIAGFDMMEVLPPYDVNATTARLAAHLTMRFLASVFAARAKGARPEAYSTLISMRRRTHRPALGRARLADARATRVDLVHIEVVPGDDLAGVVSAQFFEQRAFGIGSADASRVRPVIENQQSRSRFRCQLRQLTR